MQQCHAKYAQSVSFSHSLCHKDKNQAKHPAGEKNPSSIQTLSSTDNAEIYVLLTAQKGLN